MATLQKRKVKGHNYWYIVESKRINGKPTPIVLAYLGRAENILEKLKVVEEVGLKVKSYSYGGVFILWNFIKQLGLIELFDRYFQKKKNGKDIERNGLTPGETLALIIIQRALEPDSKRGFHKWVKKTVLPEMLRFNPQKLKSQHFWDNMDLLKEGEIEAIEEEITRLVISKFSIELDTVFYDTTNFFTFISSSNSKVKIARRGHNKQKRNDLRQFGLSLLVSRDCQIPLLSSVYEGNKNDVGIFPDSLTLIRKRLEKVARDVAEITLVFDKGNNSKKAFDNLDKSPFHYVASLSVYHDKELMNIPFSEFSAMRFEDEPSKFLKIYRTRKKIWGKERTALMYISDKLKEGQIRGIEKNLKTACEKLEALNKSLKSPKNRKKQTTENTANRMKKIINKEYIKDIFRGEVVEDEKGYFQIAYNLDMEKYEEIKEKVLGKRILLTDRHDWKDEYIIENYHGQSNIESVFRHMKNPFHNCVRPQFHWTDHKIKVHTFCCLISYLLCALMKKKVREDEIEISIEEMLNKLNSIRETTIIQTISGKKLKVIKQLEEMDTDEKILFDSLKSWYIQN